MPYGESLLHLLNWNKISTGEIRRHYYNSAQSGMGRVPTVMVPVGSRTSQPTAGIRRARGCNPAPGKPGQCDLRWQWDVVVADG